MAYDVTKLVKLQGLKDLAQRTNTQYNALKEQIEGLVTAGGEPNKLEGVKVNGTALSIAQKMVDILIGTGSANGTISVQGADVAVKGLAALAFKAEITEEELSEALKTVINSKAESSAVEDLGNRVGNNETAITKLNADSTTAGSVDYKIAQAIATLVDNPDKAMNSINELVTWTQEHAEDALELSNQVTANKNGLADLISLVGKLPAGATSTTVVDYIGEAIAALNIGDYAKTTEVTAAISAALKDYYTAEQIDAMIATDAEVEEMLVEVFGEE